MSVPRGWDRAPAFDAKLAMIHGSASLSAFVRPLGRRGYRPVGSNHVATNLVFFQPYIGVDLFPEVSEEAVLASPRAVEIRQRSRERLRHFDWVEFP